MASQGSRFAGMGGRSLVVNDIGSSFSSLGESAKHSTPAGRYRCPIILCAGDDCIDGEDY